MKFCYLCVTIAVLACAASAPAQFSTNQLTLVPPEAVWKYLDNGSDQGTIWQTSAYDATSWPAGNAQLGYGDGDETTTVGFGPNVNFKYVTTYFRHTFYATNVPSIVGLTVRLLRDDGGIVYLNGTEIFRSNMPSNFVDYLTLAATTIPTADETRFFPRAVDPHILLEGPNLLAVEIHQAGRNSSDLSFDLDLIADVILGPPVIVSQPQKQVAAPGGTATFAVQVQGSPPLHYQWQFGGEDIPGATNSTLTLTGLTAADEGNYWVTIYNEFDAIVSDKASLTLINLTGDFFQITSLSTNNPRTIEHSQFTGDDRGGIAASFADVLVTGDAGTARFNLGGLSGGASAGVRYDSLVSDLRSGTVYVLANGSNPIFSGGTVNSLIELDGQTGEVTTRGVELSANIDMNGCSGCNGIFSGFGRIVLHNATRAFAILLPSGEVQDLGPMPAPQHNFTENWAYWGVAEYFNNAHWIVYVRDYQTVARTRVPDGLTATVSKFDNLGDMASITVSPAFSRWYFHHQYTSQFRSGTETLGFADATFAHEQQPQPPAIVVPPRDRRVPLGSNATVTVVALGYPVTYQWHFNDREIPGATNQTLTLTNLSPAQVGLYSVIVSNSLGTAISSSALLDLIGGGSSVSRVAVFATDTASWNEDVRSKIERTGLFDQVDVFQISSGYPVPTLPELEQYDAVMAYSDNLFNNDVALGNVLADYVDNGGGVVIATFAFYSGSGVGIQGRIRTQGYLPFTGGNNTSGGDMGLVPDQASHPLLDGVRSFRGGISYYNNGVTIAEGAELVAHWSNGEPLVGFKAHSGGSTVVGLNFFPPSSDVNGSFWDARTDGAALMANALLFSGGGGGTVPFVPPGIRTDPASQTVLQGLDARFSVGAYGSMPLSYQWAFNGTPISDATNRALLLTDLRLDQGGAYSVVVTNLYGAVTSRVATLTVHPTRGVIGYFTDNNVSSTGLLQSIARTDFTPRRIDNIAAFDFSRLNGLMIDEVLDGPSPELKQRLPAIETWVNNGGRLIVHQRTLNLSAIGPPPLLLGLRNTTFTSWGGNDIDLLPPVNNAIAAGPYGTLNNSSLDAGNAYYQVAAVRSTLPPGAAAFLGAPPGTNQVLAFAYGLGSGLVYYSTVPLDYFLDNVSEIPAAAMRNIYTPNVIDYSFTHTASGRPVIYGGPDEAEGAVGSTVSLFVSATGKGPLQFQWLRNGVAIPGATSNPLHLVNLSTADAGSYSVIVSNDLGNVTSSQALVRVVPRLSIAVFNDPRYVNTGGGAEGHAQNVQASLEQLGHIVTPFTAASAAVTNSVLLFPEFAQRPLRPELDNTTITLLRAYASQGGVVMVQGGYANIDFLNTVFDLSLQPNGWWGGVTFQRSSQVSGTPFADDPLGLPPNYQTYSIRTWSLPAGALSVYTYSEDSALTLIPYGAGVLVHVGWNWYDAAPLHSQDGGWSQVLASAVQSKGVLPPATKVIVPLIPLGATWRYLDNGSDQGTAWRSLTFDDSTWASGPAQLGYGDGDEATVVSFGADPNNKYPTTYFRRSFNLVTAAGVTNLMLRMLRDDGAAVYLNGVELVRDCLDTAANFRTYAFCTISGDDENRFVTYALNSGGSGTNGSSVVLRTGTNVLAVEIHQSSSASSDISFDLELVGSVTAGAPVIRTQPEGHNALAGSTVVLDVIAAGLQPLSYYWRLNNEFLPGATNAILILNGTTPNQSGDYSVVVSNSLGFTVSAPARVNVMTLEGDTFRIADLSTNNARVIDDSRFVGDTRGGIAVSADEVFYSGDNTTSAFSVADLSGGTNVGRLYDALLSDLKSERIYSLSAGADLIDSGGGIVTTLQEIDGVTGELTGTSLMLSEPIDLRNRGTQVGIFAGFGRVVIYDGLRAWDIELPSGLVLDLGPFRINEHVDSENWAFWGVAEFFDGALWLTYVRDSETIVRTRVPDGRTETVARFGNLGTMASITVSPLLNRWYFHYTGYSQFSPVLYQGIGFADASVISSTVPVGPTIIKQPADQTVAASGAITLRVAVRGTGPLSYQWLFEDQPLEGATNATLRLTQVTTSQTGHYSVIASNSVNSVLSARAMVTIVPLQGDTLQIAALSTNSWTVVDDSILAGDDRGAIAVSDRRVFYTGDNGTAGFDLTDLSAGMPLGRHYDALVSELRTETVYALGNGENAIDSGGGAVSALLEVNGVTGELTGNRITLSQSIELEAFQQLGLFAGLGRIVLTEGDQGWIIEIPSGRVLNLGVITPTPHTATEVGAHWGVAEFFGGSIWLAYVQDPTTIVRARMPDGLTETIASFDYLSDMAAITVSLPLNRWYFHHQYSSSLGGFYGTLGFADAEFASNTPLIAPSILKAPVNQALGVGAPATFSVTARGTGPLTYEWLFEGTPIPDATNKVLNLPAITSEQAGRYSVRVTNPAGSATSPTALLRVLSPVTVAVFDDPTYVYTAFSDSVQASLVRLGHRTTTFRSIVSATAAGTPLLFPAFENADLSPQLTSDARDSLQGFVAGGGVVILHGSANDPGRQQRFLNSLFGYNVSPSYPSAPFARTSEANGTAFADDPEFLPRNESVSGLQKLSLPSGARSIYENSNQGTVVAVFPFGSGKVIFLGWNWNSAIPLGQQDGGWLTVLSSAIEETAPPPPHAPEILSAPDDRTVIAGTTLQFRVIASGYPLFYQWLLDDQPVTGATNFLLQLSNVTTSRAGVYSVIVSNELGSIRSPGARLRVVPPLSVGVFDDPTFVDTSSGGDGAESDNVQATLRQIGHNVRPFTTIASALTNQVLLFPEFENSDLSFSLDTTTRTALQNYVRQGGLLIAQSRSDLRFLNTVFDWSLSQTTVSSLFARTLEVTGTPFTDDPLFLPINNASDPIGTTSLPFGARNLYGDTNQCAIALLSYGAGNVIFMAWDWFSAVPLGSQDGGWRETLGSAVLSRAGITPSAPVITKHPQSQTTLVGLDATFAVGAYGPGQLRVQWFYNDQPIANATNPALTLVSLAISRSGNYFAIVSNTVGAVTSQVANLVVRPSRGVAGYYTDYNQQFIGPAARIIQAGFTPLQISDIVTFDLSRLDLLLINESSDNVPSPALLGRLSAIEAWVSRGGKLIVHDRSGGSTLSSPFLFAAAGTRFVRSFGNDLELVPPADNLVVTGPHGTLTGSSLDFANWSYQGYALRDSLPPRAVPILGAGTDTNAVVAFSYGLGAGSIYFGIIPLDAFLEFNGSTAWDNFRSIYTPNVIEHAAAFVATGSPAILAGPHDAGALAGGFASFTVRATGQAPLSYQWSFGGIPIPGATNDTFTLSGVTTNEIGFYTVVVSNPLGSVESAPAALAVIHAAPFRILSLTTNSSQIVDHSGITGDDRGGIGVSTGFVYYAGDFITGRFSAANLSGGTSAGQFYDALVSDLRSETLYTLANGNGLVNGSSSAVTALIEINGNTGEPTANRIEFSAPILLGAETGIFASYGAIVLHTGGRVYRVDLPSGLVSDLGTLASFPHSSCENWAYWGVAEFFNGSVHLVYVRDFQTIVRTRVPDGLTTNVATFSNLSDMCSFSVSISRNRWYFHYQGSAQFGGFNETLGFANASFERPPRVITPVTAVAINEDSATGPISFSTQDENPSLLLVSATSSNPLLVGPSNILLTGTSVNRTITMTPLPDQFGTATITITATDIIGQSTNRSITLTVNPVNDVPSFSAGANQTLSEDSGPQAVPNWASNIKAGPTNEDGQTLTFLVASDNPSLFLNGPSVAADGTLAFTPALNANGVATLTVRLQDNGGTQNGGGDTSSPQTFSITIMPVNDAPTFTKGPDVSVPEDSGGQAFQAWATNISPGPPDEANQTVSFAVDNNNASLFAVPPAISPDGTLSFTPAGNASGVASVTVRLRDNGGAQDTSSPQTFVIRVLPVNDRPVANPQTLTVAEDTSAQITLAGSDIDGDNLAFSIATPPAHGALTGTGATRTYRPATNFVGSDSFTFKANDGFLDSSEATVTIQVTPVNDAPIANSQSLTNNEDSALAITLTGSDVENDALTFSLVMPPAHGTLSGSGANRVYQPNTDYVGMDTITFKANDGQVDSTTASIMIQITPVNDAPVANAQTVSASGPTRIVLSGSDVDGDALTFTIVATPVHGTLSGPSSNLIYTPTIGYVGPDTFTFKANDGQVDSEAAAVNINVLISNHAPVPVIAIMPQIFLTPNATSAVIISPDNQNAMVTLDGSASYDTDSDPLTYAWYETAALPFATTVVSTNAFTVGTHTVRLVVSDGKVTAGTNATFQVISAADAVAQLITYVNHSVLLQNRKTLLVASLQAGMTSFARGEFKPGINQLQAFQNKTRAQIGPENPVLAATLTQAAQKVIDALQSPGVAPKDNRLRVTSSGRLSGGKHRFTVLSEPGEMYTIQTSTDLVHWTMWTNSISSTGTNQFIDVTAPAPQRFYRVVK